MEKHRHHWSVWTKDHTKGIWWRNCGERRLIFCGGYEERKTRPKSGYRVTKFKHNVTCYGGY